MIKLIGYFFLTINTIHRWYNLKENKKLPQLLVFHSLWKLQFGINNSVFQGLDASLGLLPSRKDYVNNFFLVSVFVLLLAIIAF